MRFTTMWYVGPAKPHCSHAQSDLRLCESLEYSMSVKLLTKYHLEFLGLQDGCIFTRQNATLLMLTSSLVLMDFSLTVKAATLIFIFGRGLAISSAKEGKSGSYHKFLGVAQTCVHFMKILT